MKRKLLHLLTAALFLSSMNLSPILAAIKQTATVKQKSNYQCKDINLISPSIIVKYKDKAEMNKGLQSQKISSKFSGTNDKIKLVSLEEATINANYDGKIKHVENLIKNFDKQKKGLYSKQALEKQLARHKLVQNIYQKNNYDLYAAVQIEKILNKEEEKQFKAGKLGVKKIKCADFMEYFATVIKDPAIKSANPDFISSPSLATTVSDPLYAMDSRARKTIFDTDVREIWNITKGENSIVAIIDTGVDYNHPDLWDNIWVNPNLGIVDVDGDGPDLDDLDLNHNHKIDGNELSRFGNEVVIGYDFVDNDNNPMDDTPRGNRGAGHGTHVAGLVAAANNDIGSVGIAPKTKLMIFKASINDSGNGFPFRATGNCVLQALEYGADVTNNSYGAYTAGFWDDIGGWFGGGGDDNDDTGFRASAFQDTADAGLVHVAAAGNDGSEANGHTPCSYENVICVGNLEKSGDSYTRRESSNYGYPVVDIGAPGTGVLSAMTDNYRHISDYYRSIDNLPEGSIYGYIPLTGTSMASPVVAGAVALIKSVNPGLDPDAISEVIRKSAKSYNRDENKPAGGGMLDAGAAVMAAKYYGQTIGTITEVRHLPNGQALADGWACEVGSDRVLKADVIDPDSSAVTNAEIVHPDIENHERDSLDNSLASLASPKEVRQNCLSNVGHSFKDLPLKSFTTP